MNKILTALALVATTGLASAQIYTTNLVPGGDYEPSDPAYANVTNTISTAGYGGGYVPDFPTAGGNPAGYLRFSYVPGQATWSGAYSVVSSNMAPFTSFSSLGLVTNMAYTALVDMKIESGASLGGFGIEYQKADGSGNGLTATVYPSGGTTSWATYAFPFTIPAGTAGIKFVCHAPDYSTASTVDFDNVRVIAVSYPVAAQITSPTNGATVFTNFTIYASASVLPGSVTNVNFYNGATLLGSSTTAPFAYTVIGATPGSAALTAVAQDSNGNSGTSSVVNVTIGTTPSQTVVGVGPNANWQGEMNVYETPQNFGAFDFSSPWNLDQLTARFSVTAGATVLTLLPAAQGDTNSTWYDYTSPSYPMGTNGAVGFKDMEANMYVEIQTNSVNGSLVTFSGTVLSNTLVNATNVNAVGNGWTSVAFIKDFAPDYSTFVETNIALTNGTAFSISLLTDAHAGRHVQYGFTTRGPDVWPTDVTNYGSVVIQSADAVTTNLYVNSSATWSGFMNVFETPQNGGGYDFGASWWGTANLRAVFNSFGLTLSPSSEGWNDDSYWYTNGTVGNKFMDASMYVEASLPGMNVVFAGNVLSNTLVSASNTNAAGNGWTSVAYIHDFAPDYSSFRSVSIPLTPGAFSISMVTVGDPARHVQYGFETVGPDVKVADLPAYGNVVIQDANVLAPTITANLSGSNVNLSFPTQLGHDYTIQYKDNLTDASWSTLTVTNGTGVNAIVPDLTGNSQRFYRLSVQ